MWPWDRERLWQRFCHGMGLAELAADPDYVDNSHRVVNRQKLVSLLQKHFDEQPGGLLGGALAGGRGPVWGYQRHSRRAFPTNRWSHAIMLLQIPHPTLGTLQQTGIPVKFSETPGAIKQHPPLLGEHTQQILLELGYSESTSSGPGAGRGPSSNTGHWACPFLKPLNGKPPQ